MGGCCLGPREVTLRWPVPKPRRWQMRRQVRDSHAGIHQIPTGGRSHDGGIHGSHRPRYGPSALPTCHVGVHRQEGIQEDGIVDRGVHRRGWRWMSASNHSAATSLSMLRHQAPRSASLHYVPVRPLAREARDWVFCTLSTAPLLRGSFEGR
jgi:hypothetical protein